MIPPQTQSPRPTEDSTSETPLDTGAQASGETSTGSDGGGGASSAGTTAGPSGQGLGSAVAGLGAALPSLGQVDKRRVLWIGGLVAAGALGVLEWPVAAAVGIGSYVAERFAKSDTAAGAPATGATSGTAAGAQTTG
jgi:hypothetical protein